MLGKLDLAPEHLLARRPRLICVDISGYGAGGPLDHKRAYDLLIQAEGGSCAMTGLPGQPAKSGVPVADVGTALYAYSAVGSPMVALVAARRRGPVKIPLTWGSWVLSHACRLTVRWCSAC